jgi:hypothetical protein
MPDRDERFSIDAGPEDALRDLVNASGQTKFLVRLSEQEGASDYSGDAPGPGEPTPSYRLYEWIGEAENRDVALKLALAGWEAKYGDQPGRYDVHISPTE